ncbi:hypothetical protein H0O02_02960 [Candidatus Micrarchaeota archaeon]|nr:hypothetical protein [Candidatus Micrarchaeota archaeon]
MLKGHYLKKLTAKMHLKSVEVGKNVEGSSPPSVFIGSYGYPHVFAGPMLAPEHGDTALLDTPEMWIPRNKTTEDIVNFRLSLIRGKQVVKINDLQNKLVGKMQEISLSGSSIESEAEFKNVPRGFALNEEHAPYGPSAMLEKFEIGNPKWEKSLEKVYYDTDLKSADAVTGLYENGAQFSQLQKAFSTGTMGIGKNRKLVPTRWSITACDSILANHLLEQVRHNEIIDNYRVHEFYSLNNYYAVVLLPTAWQYEWIEAFVHVLGSEEVVFADSETNRGKKGYSSVGGCYYSCKMGVLEGLARSGEQAGALVLREAHNGYVPLGVFNVRENVRNAMQQKPSEFFSLRDALGHVTPNFRLPLSRFVNAGSLLGDILKGRQTTLGQP